MTDAWLAAFLAGFVGVAIFSWERFEEPSYGKQDRDFITKYSPRFATRRDIYQKSRTIYTLLLLIVFCVLNVFPTLALALFRGDELKTFSDEPAWPLLVSTLILGMQNAPGIKEIERRVRSGLHAMAQVPEGVRSTIRDLQAVEFSFDKYKEFIDEEEPEFDTVAHLNFDKDLKPMVRENRTVRRWLKICCLMFVIRASYEQDFSKTGKVPEPVDPHFVDAYREEFEFLQSTHKALKEEIRKYFSDGPVGPDQQKLILDNLKQLRDRLYTFLACGIRSSHNSDLEIQSALVDLGFDVSRGSEGTLPKEPFAAFAVVVLFLSIFVTVASNILFDHWSQVYSEDFSTYRQVALSLFPENTVLLFLWSPFSAIFYMVSIFCSLVYRSIK